jgi:hypothetical protein
LLFVPLKSSKDPRLSEKFQKDWNRHRYCQYHNSICISHHILINPLQQHENLYLLLFEHLNGVVPGKEIMRADGKCQAEQRAGTTTQDSHSLSGKEKHASCLYSFSKVQVISNEIHHIVYKHNLKDTYHPIPRLGAPHPTSTTSACPSSANMSGEGRNVLAARVKAVGLVKALTPRRAASIEKAIVVAAVCVKCIL